MEITPIITKSSADNLGLREGREAYAGIIATSVMQRLTDLPNFSTAE